MTTQYEKVISEFGVEFIKRTTEEGIISWIPTDAANSDYQRYLNPEAKQSTPIVIDEAKTK
jgi:hypothetical protein